MIRKALGPVAYPRAEVERIRESTECRPTRTTTRPRGADGRLRLTARVAANGCNFLVIDRDDANPGECRARPVTCEPGLAGRHGWVGFRGRVVRGSWREAYGNLIVHPISQTPQGRNMGRQADRYFPPSALARADHIRVSSVWRVCSGLIHDAPFACSMLRCSRTNGTSLNANPY